MVLLEGLPKVAATAACETASAAAQALRDSRETVGRLAVVAGGTLPALPSDPTKGAASFKPAPPLSDWMGIPSQDPAESGSDLPNVGASERGCPMKDIAAREVRLITY